MCRFMIKKYPKDNFQKSTIVLKNEEEKDLYSRGRLNLWELSGINGRGVSQKISGNQEGVGI